MKTVAMKRSFITFLAGCSLSSVLYAQETKKDSIPSGQENKGETNSRNVMLNAASANGPREISIGLPVEMSMYSKTAFRPFTIPIPIM